MPRILRRDKTTFMCELANTREPSANLVKYRLLAKMAGIFF